MSPMEKKMKPLDEEIARIDAEIARLQAKREGVVRAREILSGTVALQTGSYAMAGSTATLAVRKRSPNIKPLILNIMGAAGERGATSLEVFAHVKEAAPNVAKDTVGSILSRLKADNALVYDGERYYDVRHAPKPSPFEIRAVR